MQNGSLRRKTLGMATLFTALFLGCLWTPFEAWAAPRKVGPQKVEPRKVVGYYAGWSIYGRDYQVEDVPADKLTHLNYAFAKVAAEDGSLIPCDSHADSINLPKLQQLKKKHPHLKTLISIGGATDSEEFPAMAANEKMRKRFIETTIAFIREHDFDGADLDWEFPQVEDTENFTQLLAALRVALNTAGQQDGKTYELSIASGSSGYTLKGTDLGAIHPYLDHVNLMAYDYHGTWSNTTNFNAPLYGSSSDPEDQPGDAHELWVEGSLNLYLNNLKDPTDDLVPRDKLVIGIPLHGAAWGGVPDVNHGLYQKSTGPASPEKKESYDYRDLVARYLVADSGYTRHWHPQAQVPWLYSPKAEVFVTYDGPESIALKSDKIVELGLAGAMFWELSADDDKNTLVSVIHDKMKKTSKDADSGTERPLHAN